MFNGTPGEAAIDARIATLKNIMGEDDQLVQKQIAEELSMVKGSALHTKHAATSMFTSTAQVMYDQSRGVQLQAYRVAQASQTRLNPFVSAEYKPYTDRIVEDIRGRFNQIRQIENLKDKLGELTPEAQYFLAETRMDIATHLDETMRELYTNKGVGNLLDVYDSIEASIIESFGEGSEKVLDEIVHPAGSYQVSESLMELREDSMRRRAGKVIQSRASQDMIDTLSSVESDFSYLDQVNSDRLAANAARTGIPVPSAAPALSFQNINEYTAKGLLNEMHKQFGEAIKSGIAGSSDAITDFFGIDKESYNYLMGTAGRTRSMTEQELALFEEQKKYLKVLSDENEIITKYGTGRAAAAPGAIPTPAPTMPAPGPTTSYIDDLITSVDDFFTASSAPAPDKLYTRFGRMLKSGGMKELFQDSILRNSAFALVGLAAFGFIYSGIKERTPEQIEGPPLLPGGSAYETDYPKALPSISDLKYLNPTTMSMSYKIQINGSQEQAEKAQQILGSVTNSRINTTMYNGLPRLGRDPYQGVASSF